MLKILYYTAVDANLSVFSRAYEDFDMDKLKLKVYHRRNFLQASVVESFFRDLEKADVLLIQFMGGSASMAPYGRLLENCPAHVKVFTYSQQPVEKSDLLANNYFKPEEERRLFDYFFFGGTSNIGEMFSYLRKILVDKDEVFKEPKELPLNGTYYKSPNFDKKGGVRIGITFYRNYYINGDAEFVDAVIEEIEKSGNSVHAVFLSTVSNEEKDTPHISETLEKYFTDSNSEPNIDVLISLLMFSKAKSGDKYLGALNLPVLQGILCTENYNIWKNENYGLTPAVLTINVALPEVEGTIITIPIATKEFSVEASTKIDVIKYKPITDRVAKLVRMAVNYGKLRLKPNNEKKVAIIMHNYPPSNENIGCAYGLDTQKSIINILQSLKAEGYLVDEVYSDSKELMDQILERATNDEDWNSWDKISKSLTLDKKRYGEFFSELTEKASERIVSFWGRPPGTAMLSEEQNIMLPGLINGNCFIGIQPHRNHGHDPKSAYHDPDVPVGHHYYGLYKWIRDDFKADAVIHVGKHGSLEWLPGKAVALSEDCHPDFSISDLPNFYPYIINNPGEGTQAKRRSYACIIDHLEPAMNDADLYDDFNDLEKLIEEYIDNKRYSKENTDELIKKIELAFEDTGLAEDFSAIEDFEARLNKTHEYLEEMKESLINNGLHILGECPQGEDLVHFIAALTRLESPGIPSIRETVARSLGYDMEEIYSKREEGSLLEKELAKEQLKEIKEKELSLIRDLIKGEAPKSKELAEFSKAVEEKLLPNLYKTENELKNLLKGLKGEFVEPGPSGAPTRGQADILPTGRNFYGINPNTLPTRAAWESGKILADKLIKRYLLENEGVYPENIGYVLFGSPTIRTKGEDVAQIMYLLGLRPQWQKGGMNVTGIEVIDPEELDRPRIDVTIRITGFFRDAFPGIVNLLDEGIMKLALLKESDEDNYIAKHVQAALNKFSGKEIRDEDALREATYRIFSAKPGAYGTGVNGLIDRKDWKDKGDLAEMYLNFGGYVYGKGSYGVKNPNLFRERLSQINIAVKNIDTKETDVLANDDNYSYLGGMIAAAQSTGNTVVAGYVGDSSNPKRIKIKSVQEETRFVVRTKLLNPKWYNSLKRHGFKGATDISKTVDYTFGWDATTDVIDDLTYEKIVENFIRDEEFSSWLKNANPWAMQNIIERMLEAIQRGMWDADEDMINFLKGKYLENEGDLEGS